LFHYLAAGDSITDFLNHFPTVSREVVTKAIKMAGETLVAGIVPADVPH
jgi:uncharacterized protein (DUF433 family)